MPRTKKPKPNPTHWSLKPDGGKTNKGSYYRRIEDIQKGLKKIDASKLPPGGRFLFLYYGCEKLGKGIVGIAEEWEAKAAYDQSLELEMLKAGATAMKLPVSMAELDTLFLTGSRNSARHWRNEIVHNFGPSNVDNVVQNSTHLNRRMHDFLERNTPAVLKYLKIKYENLL
jgi:hypothetical protein